MISDDIECVFAMPAPQLPPIAFENDGPRLLSTSYWTHPLAERGLCYATGNAGAWRLLVPRPREIDLAEMRTGRRASIEASLRSPKDHVDIVFEDGTTAPYCLSMSPQCFDRAIRKGKSRLLVYTAAGLALDLPLRLKVDFRQEPNP